MSDLIAKARAQGLFWFLIAVEAFCDVIISVGAVTVASLTGVDWDSLTNSQQWVIIASGTTLLAKDILNLVRKGRNMLQRLEPSIPKLDDSGTRSWTKQDHQEPAQKTG